MSLADIGVEEFYQSNISQGNYQLKEEIEDFVVYEVNAPCVSTLVPIINLDQFKLSETAYDNYPKSAPKEERKPIYESVRHFPFKQLRIVEGQFTTEETDRDIFCCTLIKYNVNTMDAVHIIAKRLEVSARNIQIGGNKDKRGVTFQEISIDCSFKKLFNYAFSLSQARGFRTDEYGDCETLRMKNEEASKLLEGYMEVKPYETTDRLLICNIRKGIAKRLGDNTGNRFRIRIRGLTSIDTPPSYFLNYYGHQRFGKSLNNHIIGEHILNKEYGKALDLILESGVENKKEADQENIERKHSSLQRYIERMRKQKANDKYIVRRMERMSLMMYMHAYQSYLFNDAVNIRYKRQAPMPGDCVLVNGEFIECSENEELENIYIPLEKRNDKFLKGGFRKMVESFGD
ncbi:tRNA pseudouridine13 synthase, partial [Pancytospora epiphaga]